MAGFLLPFLPSFAVLIAIVAVPIISIWALTYAFEWRKQLESDASFPTTAVLDDPTSLSKVRCPSIFDPASKYFSLIMPAYNESSRLPPTLDETLGYLQHRASSDKSFTYEIIIVDDGSTDNTVKVAYEYVHKYSFDVVRIVKLGSNLGKGAAVKKGMLCARGKLLLMLDSDGATRITDLEKLEKEINSLVEQKASRSSPNGKMQSESSENEAAAAFGSRAHLEKHALATRKWYRNLLMKGFHLCVLFVAGHGIRDTQCGFKMFTRAAARQLFVNMRLRRFTTSATNWWDDYGAEGPELQNLAIRILSQGCSASAIERLWSTYNYTTPKKRNRLGSQKASDLVFVNANLRMLHKYKTGELASRANKFYSLEIRNEESSDEKDEAPDIPEDLVEEENEEDEEEDSIVPQRIRMEANDEND